MELVSVSLEAKILFARIQFIGIASLPIAWLHFALVYTGRHLHRSFWITIFGITAVVLFFVLFAPLPNIFWGHPALAGLGERFNAVDYDYGPLFYRVLMPLTNLLILASLGLLVHLWAQRHVVYTRQTSLIIVGTIIPLVTNILYVFGITPVPHMNYSSAMLSITGMLFGSALFKYQYLELYPLARDVIFEQMNDAVLVLNDKNLIIDANRRAEQLFSDPVDLVGSDFGTALHADVLKGMEGMETGRSEEAVAIRGNLYDVTYNRVEGRQGHGSCTVILFHDVTERETLHRKIEELGRRDPLTGVYNRRELIAHIEKFYTYAFSEHLSLSIIMLDIDGFKDINDTYGHETGDKALEIFAKILYKTIQPNDIVGRYGGDEFVIVSMGSDSDQAGLLAETIREQVSSRIIPTSQGSFSLKVSLGVKTFLFDGSTPMTDTATGLLSEVDKVLYMAKGAGKDRVVIG